MDSRAPYGYLLAHFVQAPQEHGERIYFSLSDEDSPLSWHRVNGGRPVLSSDLGTTGVRDPFIVRGHGEFYLIATDLRIYGGDGLGWDEWRRHGSRSIVVWRSEDLVTWSSPWLADVAPTTAGMAWAPEASFDEVHGEYLVYWSSTLYGADDPGHRLPSYSRLLAARTTDFRVFSSPGVLIDRGRSVIDTTFARDSGEVHRFTKDDSRRADSLRLHQEVGSDIESTDFALVETRIGDDRFGDVEAPLVFRDHATGRWYLWLDQYSDDPQGYVALTKRSLSAGRWAFVPAERFSLPANTKHGSVLSLRGAEWPRLRRRFTVADERYPAVPS